MTYGESARFATSVMINDFYSSLQLSWIEDSTFVFPFAYSMRAQSSNARDSNTEISVVSDGHSLVAAVLGHPASPSRV
jgi:hypothetical protein